MQREEDKGIKEGRETQGTERPTMRIKHALSGAEIAITARTDRLSTPEYDTGELAGSKVESRYKSSLKWKPNGESIARLDRSDIRSCEVLAIGFELAGFPPGPPMGLELCPEQPFLSCSPESHSFRWVHAAFSTRFIASDAMLEDESALSILGVVRSSYKTPVFKVEKKQFLRLYTCLGHFNWSEKGCRRMYSRDEWAKEAPIRRWMPGRVEKKEI
ncbi:hypothetical protein QYF36_008492 [Acer negundo]|nr:hypothetical protein QYF36_008492 [Acer negundo]